MVKSFWKLSENAVADLTPDRVRDLIVDCFFAAQHETLARVKHDLGASRTDDASLLKDVIGAVRLAFKETGGDYDHPTVASLAKVSAVLERKAEAWEMLSRMEQPAAGGPSRPLADYELLSSVRSSAGRATLPPWRKAPGLAPVDISHPCQGVMRGLGKPPHPHGTSGVEG